MTESPGKQEPQLSNWEIEVGNSYLAYLLAQKRMEDELEFSGKDNPLYNVVDGQMRKFFDDVSQNHYFDKFIPETIKLPDRGIRTSLTGKYKYDSPYSGLFPAGGGKQKDPYARFYIPRTNEVLLIDAGTPFRPLDTRMFPYKDFGGNIPNNDFIGLDAIRKGEAPDYAKIVKIGEKEEYGKLTFNEMWELISKVETEISFADNATQQDTEKAVGLVDTIQALRKQRRKLKEEARQSNGKNLKARIGALRDSISKKISLKPDYSMVRFPGESNQVDELEIDNDDNARYGARKYGLYYNLYFSQKEGKLVIAPFIAKRPSGLRGWMLKSLSGGRLVPNDITIDLSKAVEAPDRYWCKTAPVIAERLIKRLPEKQVDKVKHNYGISKLEDNTI